MDTLTSEQRSALMSKVRGKDTAPEWFVRRIVHALGYRYRLHDPSLPGKPDLVFKSRRKVVFVHGCFWHWHTCRHGLQAPKSNAEFWRVKREKNRARDRKTRRTLKTLGWDVLVVWECQCRDADLIAAIVTRFLENPTKASHTSAASRP